MIYATGLTRALLMKAKARASPFATPALSRLRGTYALARSGGGVRSRWSLTWTLRAIKAKRPSPRSLLEVSAKAVLRAMAPGTAIGH